MPRRNPRGPTARIVGLAESSPGGLIRFHEAVDEYIQGSEAARRHFCRGETNHHMWVSQVLKRHFVKVEGVPGHYVLYNFTLPGYPDYTGDWSD